MSKRYPMPMPYGWFHVSYTHELEKNQAKPIRYFGKDMVLFRTESGEVACLDAFCPHMGAHLGHAIHELSGKGGKVVDETVVCPFHGWRFDTRGVCVEVPYAKNIPPKIDGKQCLKKWRVVEKNQSIWVWYHPDDEQEPMWQPAECEEAYSDEWGPIENRRYFINTVCQELAENGADPAHFRYVHRTVHVPDVENAIFDGHTRKVKLTSKMRTPRGDVDGVIAFDTCGPGQAINRFSGICDTILFGNVTPIDESNIEVNFGFMKKKVNGVVPEGGVAEAIKADITQQLEEDRPIWEHKVYRPLPILCDGDGPIAKFRKWYAQFYVDWEEDRMINNLYIRDLG